jgi:2-dehydropantoate 2-reductase
MQNGIPFWYFHATPGRSKGGRSRASIRPADDRVHPAARLIGCVVYPASDLVSPGVIRHVEGNRLPLGELDGSRSERVQRVARLSRSPASRHRCSTTSAPRSG